MSELEPEGADHASQENAEAIQRVSVILPYSLSNVVFMQMLPFWMYFGVSVIFLVVGAVSLPADGDGNGSELLAIGAIGVPVSLGVLVVGWCALWRWAVRGFKAAVIILYIIYIPAVLAGLCMILYAASRVFGVLSTQNYGRYAMLAGAIVALVLGLMLLCNLYEKGLWDFVRLANRCPSCHRWRFGRIKRPTTVQCPSCNVLIEFVRGE